MLPIATKRQLGLILDIVPNHGTASSRNRWWQDVLENGPSSQYADYRHRLDALKPDTANKVLLPVLGDQFGKVLEDGQRGFGGGAFWLHCYESRYRFRPAPIR
jgi:(1->4)-alpha-D-glucan 1-alpha-D-glucosylmutase